MTADDQQDGGEEQGLGLEYDLVTMTENPTDAAVSVTLSGGDGGGLTVALHDDSGGSFPCYAETGVSPEKLGNSTWRGTLGNILRDEAVLPDGADSEKVKSNFVRVCSGIAEKFEEEYADKLRSRTVDRLVEETDTVHMRRGEGASVSVTLTHDGDQMSHEFNIAEWRTGSAADEFCHAYYGHFMSEVDIVDDDEWQTLRNAWEEDMDVTAVEKTSDAATALTAARRHIMQTINATGDVAALATDDHAALVERDPKQSQTNGPTVWVPRAVITEALDKAEKGQSWRGTLSQLLQERGIMRGGSKEYKDDLRWPFKPEYVDVDVDEVLSSGEATDGDDEADEEVSL